MQFETSKLIEAAEQQFGSTEKFAEAVSLTAEELAEKLQGVKGGFTLTEIARCAKVLHLTPADVNLYFFTPKEVIT